MEKSNLVMERYSRQVLLKEIGNKQETLMNSTVALVGLGALGTHAAELLTRTGIENLILIDNDKIEESNLQRQTLFVEKDVGESKAKTAKEKLIKINSGLKITAHHIRLTEDNTSLLDRADIVIDCSDNLKTRFIINKYCKDIKKPWIYSSAVKTSGYVMPIFPEGPCLECFLKETNLDTACTVGILNTIVASIASLAVTLAIKILTGTKLFSQLYYYNIWTQEFRKINVKKNKDCKLCNISNFWIRN